MPLFECSKCHCYENTALSNWAVRYLHAPKNAAGVKVVQPPLCSECDPEIGKWHDEFPKIPAAGMLRERHDPNQFLYHSRDEAHALNAHGPFETIPPAPERSNP
jgi:hypothetical protein